MGAQDNMYIINHFNVRLLLASLICNRVTLLLMQHKSAGEYVFSNGKNMCIHFFVSTCNLWALLKVVGFLLFF